MSVQTTYNLTGMASTIKFGSESGVTTDLGDKSISELVAEIDSDDQN